MATRRASRKAQPAGGPRLVSVGTREIPVDEGGGLFGRRSSGRLVTGELLVEVANPTKAYVRVDRDPRLQLVVRQSYPEDTVEPLGMIRSRDLAMENDRTDPSPAPVEFRAKRPLKRYGMGFGPASTGDATWAG